MSQVIDIFTNSFTVLPIHRLLMATIPHSLLYLPRPTWHLPRLMALLLPHIGVLLMNCKKLCVYFMKRIMLNFLFLLLTLIISTICKMNNQKYWYYISIRRSFPEINLTTNPRNPAKIAVCDGCKSNSDNRTRSNTSMYHTSLGRSAGTNPFVEYRSLTSQMGYSKNRRTFSLYSGMIGAFLQNVDLSAPGNRWYHPSLPYACNWL